MFNSLTLIEYYSYKYDASGNSLDLKNRDIFPFTMI